MTIIETNCFDLICKYDGSYLRLPVRGVYELKQLPNRSRSTCGPKNPFSGSSSKVLKGFFDRFEKFSFSVILGRLKVEIDDFPIINSIGKTHGKPCFLASILTLRRPKITKNENFQNRSKKSFNTLLELLENGFLGS